MPAPLTTLPVAARVASMMIVGVLVVACGATPASPTPVSSPTPAIASASPIDDPVAVVNQIIGLIEAGAWTRIADLACAAERESVAEKFDIATSPLTHLTPEPTRP